MDQQVIDDAINLATRWQDHASEKMTEFEKTFHVKMQKMLSNPIDKIFLIDLMDQSFRSKEVSRVENQIEYLFDKYGMATFFTEAERFLVFLFRHAGTYFPQLSIPMFIDNIRSNTKSMVLDGEERILNKHLKLRHKDKVRVNLNLIGEIVLGEKEAHERIDKYLLALENPNIDYISIKISTLYSQINSLAFDSTIEVLVERLTLIFNQAKEYTFINQKGQSEYKFINLDMEEYKDLPLTVTAFKKALEKPELRNFKAGIVLQAYLPDSHLWQKDLTQWAKCRVAEGGSPIKVRLVKGANMEMEETEASLRGWPAAPYRSKLDTDTNYKLMAEYGTQPENIKAVALGVASHNLFDLAYGFELAKKNNVLDYFSLEMLEGMSEAARVAISQVSGQQVILYAPTASKHQFTNAIAYLVRRLDENTNEDNFMRYSFGLKTGTPLWDQLKQGFLNSFENREKLFIGSRRKQNRQTEEWSQYDGGTFSTHNFENEPDTDFVLVANQNWAKDILSKWKPENTSHVSTRPLVVAGQEISSDREAVTCYDKSQNSKVPCGAYLKSTAEDLDLAVRTAKSDIDGWRTLATEVRHKILGKVANNLRQRRGALIGVAAAELGKVFTETDVEVSEAIDFLEFYPHSVAYFFKNNHITFKAKGVGLVVPPWNFPIAIPAGGLAAALAAGNTVILKPASNAVLCAYELCKSFWDAGVSKNTLQFVPCPGALAGKHLISRDEIDFVILTGGESTAMEMLRVRPNLFLTAETGGKDATIVTSMSDREQAIKNVIHSAFSNSGQKCSATSLLILENEVYYDHSFKEALADAASSLLVGSAWDFKNKLGPLATKPSGALKQAIETLDEGESWLVKPEFVEDNEFMLKPAIKWGVREGSFSHKTELFGPVLSVMRADDLKHAIKIVNDTGYGLTSGIESLDEREVNYWKENIHAGNLYINRGTTGAIVLRQPFGGLGKSAIGSGRKAGVYNYITQFMDINDVKDPWVPELQSHRLVDLVADWQSSHKHSSFAKDLSDLSKALQSYLYHYKHEFDKEHDYFKLRGEDNLFRYLKLNKVSLRVCEDDSLFSCISRILAAKICGVSINVSVEENMNNEVSSFLKTYKDKILSLNDQLSFQSDNQFISSFAEVDRVIYASIDLIPDSVFLAASQLGLFIVRTPALKEGRIELLNYLNEQSISHSYHRYGNLGERGLQQ